MYSKWKIDLPGMENYRFGEDKNLYRLPYSDPEINRDYSLRKITKNRNCWVISGKRWNEHQLRPHIIEDESPILLTKGNEMPF